jgi:hypothetical protein
MTKEELEIHIFRLKENIKEYLIIEEESVLADSAVLAYATALQTLLILEDRLLKFRFFDKGDLHRISDFKP